MLPGRKATFANYTSYHRGINGIMVDDPFDYNRDRLVNATDRAIARAHQTGPTTTLRPITASAADAAFGESVDHAPAAMSTSLDQLDWLYELPQARPRIGSSHANQLPGEPWTSCLRLAAASCNEEPHGGRI